MKSSFKFDYGISEIVNDEGRQVGEGNGLASGTSIHNYAMPFISIKRICNKKQMEICSCGRNFPLMQEITTKAEDIITTKDGRYISPPYLRILLNPSTT